MRSAEHKIEVTMFWSSEPALPLAPPPSFWLPCAIMAASRRLWVAVTMTMQPSVAAAAAAVHRSTATSLAACPPWLAPASAVVTKLPVAARGGEPQRPLLRARMTMTPLKWCACWPGCSSRSRQRRPRSTRRRCRVGQASAVLVDMSLQCARLLL